METLHAAFSPDAFRREGHLLIDQLADLLESLQKAEGKALPWHTPGQQLAYWEARMDGAPQSVSEFLHEVAGRSIQIHHPHYMGHQVCAPAPGAALAGLVTELLNNSMAVYEMGPAATALERWIVRRTCTALGYPEGDGVITSGGTLATLTALLAARARQLGEESLAQGTDRRWAVMTSEETHYCVARAVQVMGWGSEGLVTVPTDEQFKIRPEMLDVRYEEACARGRKPIALVASVCSTSTGSYDDLHVAADFCRRRGLWLHADGAHGAAVAFCPELRGKIAGIERADSAILDFHKLLLTPALATVVLFRERSASWAAFHERAQYLFPENETEAWRDSGRRTYECTKLSISVKIATLWRVYGEQLFAEHLRAVHDLARDFAARLRERAPFEVAVEPESNIVCFRLRPPGLEDAAVDALNARARQRVLEDGRFYIVQTTLRGRVWLRTALMNPFTKLVHLDAMLDAVEAAAKQARLETSSAPKI
jgi:L-2,4-diaminobutyrate decarboxylase